MTVRKLWSLGWKRILFVSIVLLVAWIGYAAAQGNGNGYSAGVAAPYVLDASAIGLDGDITGPATANTAKALQHTPVSAAGPTSGQFFVVSDAGVWTPVTLSGQLVCSTTNPGSCAVVTDAGIGTLGGDVTGPAGANTVTKFQNIAMAPGAVLADQIMGVTDAGTWAPLNVMGDLTNSATNPGAFTIVNVTNTNFWTVTPSATVNTTNATPTTIYTTGTLAAATTQDFYVQLGAQNTSGTGDWFFAEYRFAYQRNGAGPVLVGSAPVALNLRGSTTGQTYPGLTEAVSSNTLVLSVTGLAATNITWNIAVSLSHVP